jgi:hypothetical protein
MLQSLRAASPLERSLADAVVAVNLEAGGAMPRLLATVRDQHPLEP